MEKKIFCPKCGSSEQVGDSYCRHCGEWLPDMSSDQRGRFRSSTREQSIRRMRTLQLFSIVLSLASTAVTILFLRGYTGSGILGLPALFGFLVAIYQIASLFIGFKVLTPKTDHGSSTETQQISPKPVNSLYSGDQTEFIKPDSVVEGTTELLEPTHILNQKK